MTTADAATIIRCPDCETLNRVRPVAKGTPRCRSCKRRLPWIVNATTASFDDEVNASVPVLVDLWAPWCGPCRQVAPVLQKMALDRAGSFKVVKVNVDEEPQLSARFAVQSIPMMILFVGGREVDRMVGASPMEQMRNWVDSRQAAAGGAAG